ncbi:MAG: transporter substrate-binding domain-containing protein [Actinobacteria bacterium]|nr:MAG: transporter substrate-binding domain-containing protein [Actinomycetota bacterium]TML48874.1 MAG: transporter substrate-binding domain-containing protein [Actinomycetota bacterium]
MRKTILILALVVSAAAAGSAGAGGNTTTFTFCTDPSFPPMEFVGTNGGIRGFDVEMASALAKTFGATAKPLKTAFPGLIPALNAKKCVAVISGIFVTPDRLKQAGAVDYMETHRVFVVRGGNPKHVTGPSSLKGLNVVTQAGTKYEEYLKALKKKIGFSLQTYPGDNDAVAQVILGRADVDLTQDTSFAFQAKAHPGKIAVAYTFPAKDRFGVYFRKGDPLGAKIKTGIAKLRANRTLVQLALKYKIPVADVK